jgi:hypothetical protein
MTMLKKLTLAATVAAATLTAVPAAADAHPSRYRHNHYSNYDRGYGYAPRYYGNRRYADRYYGRGGYYRGGRYQYRCRDKGTTGTIIGAVAGGLLGREIARGDGYYRRGDGTTGAIIGAGVGALAGRAIDRDC